MNFPLLLGEAGGWNEAVENPLDHLHSAVPRWKDLTVVLLQHLGVHFLRHTLFALG